MQKRLSIYLGKFDQSRFKRPATIGLERLIQFELSLDSYRAHRVTDGSDSDPDVFLTATGFALHKAGKFRDSA